MKELGSSYKECDGLVSRYRVCVRELGSRYRECKGTRQ